MHTRKNAPYELLEESNSITNPNMYGTSNLFFKFQINILVVDGGTCSLFFIPFGISHQEREK